MLETLIRYGFFVRLDAGAGTSAGGANSALYPLFRFAPVSLILLNVGIEQG
jgi:hypothetical protein